MPTSWRFPIVVRRARQAAGRLPLATTAGEPASEVFADPAVDEALAACAPGRGLRTARDRAYLAWRYGNEVLGYRVVFADLGAAARGSAVFRRRRRGDAVEAVLCDVVVPDGDARTARGLARTIARVADADYVLRIDRRPLTADPFLHVPRIGPVLACRPLDGSAAPALGAWSLTMGDVELF
jgi:hypothetical protein